ncbi:Zinc finger protein 62 [Nymphon striatum]|nr:Zinc finger protein 62 [Nymphon striatum]
MAEFHGLLKKRHKSVGNTESVDQKYKDKYHEESYSLCIPLTSNCKMDFVDCGVTAIKNEPGVEIEQNSSEATSLSEWLSFEVKSIKQENEDPVNGVIDNCEAFPQKLEHEDVDEDSDEETYKNVMYSSMFDKNVGDVKKNHIGTKFGSRTHTMKLNGVNMYECDICHKCFSEKCTLTTHMRLHTNDRLFECDFCLKRFTVQSKLTAHTRVHTREKPFECDICHKCYSQMGALTRHKLKHANEKPFECDTCHEGFTEKFTITTHMCLHTGTNDSPLEYIDEETYKNVMYSSMLEENVGDVKENHIETTMKLDYVNMYKCDVCLKCFAVESKLTEHKRVHTTEKPFECDICHKFFSRNNYLIVHKRLHTNEDRFECDICHTFFRGSDSLARHKFIHTNEKDFGCDICNKLFNHRSTLSKHKKRVHSNDKPFECDVCHKCFSERVNLTTHKLTHRTKRPFGCPVCNKRFIDRSSLNKHKSVHTNEKPFECDICHKCFSEKVNLTTHKLIHTKEKALECDICHKVFSKSRNLTRHKLTHTEEKPFRCHVCNRHFKNTNSLKVHKRLHTNEMPFECDICHKCFKIVAYSFGQAAVHYKLLVGNADRKIPERLKHFQDGKPTDTYPDPIHADVVRVGSKCTPARRSPKRRPDSKPPARRKRMNVLLELNASAAENTQPIEPALFAVQTDSVVPDSLCPLTSNCKMDFVDWSVAAIKKEPGVEIEHNNSEAASLSNWLSLEVKSIKQENEDSVNGVTDNCETCPQKLEREDVDEESKGLERNHRQTQCSGRRSEKNSSAGKREMEERMLEGKSGLESVSQNDAPNFVGIEGGMDIGVDLACFIPVVQSDTECNIYEIETTNQTTDYTDNNEEKDVDEVTYKNVMCSSMFDKNEGDVKENHIETKFSSRTQTMKLNDVNVHKCDICQKIFNRSGCLTRHKLTHTNEKPFECHVCHKCFSRSDSLAIHQLIHTNEKPFECQVCHKCFNDRSSLSKHRLIHTDEKPFECNVCHKCFNDRSSLSKHKIIHTDEKPFKCNVCHKCFSRSDGLTIHQAIHTNEKLFECDICHKCFRVSGTLSRHKLIHTNEKPFGCDVCNKRFNDRSSLSSHKSVHTNEKPFECDICHKCFRLSGILTKHKLIHTNEKPFGCDICNKRFKYKSNLSSHKSVHTNEKPFECDICHKCFRESSGVTRHRRLHTNEMPFECDICHKCFKEVTIQTHHCHKQEAKWMRQQNQKKKTTQTFLPKEKKVTIVTDSNNNSSTPESISHSESVVEPENVESQGTQAGHGRCQCSKTKDGVKNKESIRWRDEDGIDFLQTLDQDYGNCYTFNSAWVYQDSKFVFRKDRIKKVRSPGPMSGLEIIFNINQEEYIPGLSHEAGLRIVFHDSKELPHSVLEQGINIPPGMNSVIQLRKSEFIRLANYKDKCATKYTQDLLKAFPISIKDSEMYNTGKCVGLMWQLCVIDTCKCRDVNSLGNIDYPDLPGCNVELNSTCFDLSMESYRERSTDMKANFDITPTSTIWPADAFADRVMRKYSNREKSASNFRKSFGKFGLHLSSLLKSQVIESKRFTIDTLLSNFGGLVGMYIGISVLSIFDLIKYVMFKSDKKKEEHKRSKSITPLTSQKKRNSFSTQRKVIFTKGMDRTLEIQCKANFIFSIQCHNIIQVQ